MSPDDISIGGFREWFPLELHMSPEEYADHVVEHFDEDPTPEGLLRAMAAGLTHMTEQLKAMDDDQTLLLAAWVLLPPGGVRLDVRTVARLQAVRVPVGMTPDEMVADLIDGAQLHQPATVEEIATASGPAHLVRVRTYEEAEHGLDLREVSCIFWLPADENFAITLTTLPMDDLVLASDAAGALVGLAETVKGVPA